MGGFLFDAFVYLCAAVIAVPIAKRLGLGSILGYLIAGILIGPVIGLVDSRMQEIRHFAELGVVMMLFLVGLELEPRRLWEMRSGLLGLGGLQLVVTAVAIALIAILLGTEWRTAIAIGAIFSLSSTAMVLQTLEEKGLTKTAGGRSVLSVLLTQDIAFIPLLALLPLLALPALVGADSTGLAGHAEAHHEVAMSLVADLPGWGRALMVVGAVALVLLGGHFLSRPLFRFIAASRLREIFTASALLLVIGIALLMTLVGLSPALGTFLAGVVLADNEFRHELRSDIEPFKGLLLGLFFITVGAGIDLDLLRSDFSQVLALTLGLMAAKGLVLFWLARWFRMGTSDGWLFTLGLAQAGEFGFVLLGFSVQTNVIAAGPAATLSLVVALSMLLTPVLFILYDRWVLPRLGTVGEKEPDTIDEKGTVVIAGSGRFGQIVNRLLVASGIRTVVLDHEAATIESLRMVGIKSYYGDASRPDLLHAAGIESAAAFVVAIDDRERALAMVEHVRRHHPQVVILARAHDVNHHYLLEKAGVDWAVRETFDSSLALGARALKTLGLHPYKVEKMVHAFRRHDEVEQVLLNELWEENPDMARNRAYLARVREHAETLVEVMEADRLQLHDRTERGWTPPPRGYAQELED